ncbi:hypothetical protein A2716_02930 [candidate division WWE3 bacterium RIFCSPHIGHO2_01_FULL_40_23]|uniref:PIN domain-containing protein n=1 Tax=candidate division WWE3 bacterium RIFCSPLOWO2_01_FULL_41_18 TaxID=1802625 RepID=A0A1F4VC01_UNCKA|nr:MAG: hypothetical protein A2716_02930 [candidate division WWE3 bacterium RIFCSPHIGHO2_01_FULL_40_23]OGC54766.1 MAG: hypothetical protein A3A78_05125 [candidate division WWE3 bacterium RIFCSPLOWO2_01_FULL_41_18]
MYLLDTDILIWVLRGKKDIVDWVSRLKEEGPLYICVISMAEIYKNIFPSEIGFTEEFLKEHIHIPINEKIAKQAGFIWQQYSKGLSSLSLIDCLIASACLQNGLTLVTFNVKHFPMEGLKVLRPLGRRKN